MLFIVGWFSKLSNNNYNNTYNILLLFIYAIFVPIVRLIYSILKSIILLHCRKENMWNILEWKVEFLQTPDNIKI